jgi:recombination protein RecT
MSDALAVISGDIWSTRDAFDAVLVDRSVSFEREAGFALQLLQNSEYLVKTASSNRQSLVNAITNVAALGVSLNPAKKQAYLVPRDGKVMLDISWMGLIDLAVQCKSILWAQAHVVYSSEALQIHGYDKPPTHVRDPFAKDRGTIVGAYCVAKLATGDYLTETMTTEEIDNVRDRSSAWKAWIKDKRKCPWVTDDAEMRRKTVTKRAAKYWPRTGGDDRLENAIHHLNTDGGSGGGEGFVSESAPAAATLDDNVAEVEACKTEADLTKVYARVMGEYAKVNDGTTARTFKKKALAHREALRNGNTIDMEQGGTN